MDSSGKATDGGGRNRALEHIEPPEQNRAVGAANRYDVPSVHQNMFPYLGNFIQVNDIGPVHFEKPWILDFSLQPFQGVVNQKRVGLRLDPHIVSNSFQEQDICEFDPE